MKNVGLQWFAMVQPAQLYNGAESLIWECFDNLLSLLGGQHPEYLTAQDEAPQSLVVSANMGAPSQEPSPMDQW